jgi:hypothetical protein
LKLWKQGGKNTKYEMTELWYDFLPTKQKGSTMSEIAHRVIERTVLWNGGSDTYEVDLDDVVDAPETATWPDWWKHHQDRTVRKDGWWLLCRYMNHDWYSDAVLKPDPKRGAGVHPDNKMVRIIRRIRGGD